MTKSEKNEGKGNNLGIALIISFLIFSMAILFLYSKVNIVWVANTDDRGNLEVAIQDQTTEIIDLHVSILIQPINISQNTSIDDTHIVIEASSPLTVGNILCLKEQSAFYQGEILSSVSLGGNLYNVTVDSPLDYAFTTVGGCSERQINLNVDGSVTPVIASVSPSKLNVDWDITRVMMSITDSTAMDDGKFGGITGGLANGIIFRKVDGISKNIFNAKTNGDLAAHAYDVTYIPDTLGPSGQYGLRMRRSFNGQDKNGVTIRLNSDTNDTFELIIQDDLTGLDNFQLIVQGHVVDQ